MNRFQGHPDPRICPEWFSVLCRCRAVCRSTPDGLPSMTSPSHCWVSSHKRYHSSRDSNPGGFTFCKSASSWFIVWETNVPIRPYIAPALRAQREARLLVRDLDMTMLLETTLLVSIAFREATRQLERACVCMFVLFLI